MTNEPRSIWQTEIPFPAFLRSWPRKVFNRKNVHRCAFTIACLATLTGLFYGTTNLSGKLAWDRYRASFEANGESFDFASFVPPPIADERNFAADPMFQPMFDYQYRTNGVVWKQTNWSGRLGNLDVFGRRPPRPHRPESGDWRHNKRTVLKEWQVFYRGTNFPSANYPAELIEKFWQKKRKLSAHPIVYPMTPEPQSPAEDVLMALSIADQELTELQNAAKRPSSRFPIHYEETSQALLPHLSYLKGIAAYLKLRSVAALETGNTDQALDDLLLTLRLADSIRTEPLAISLLLRAAIVEYAIHIVWEGSVDRRWSDENLQTIHKALSAIGVLADVKHVLHTERAFFVSILHDMVTDRMESSVTNQLFPERQKDLIAERRFFRLAPRGWFYHNAITFCEILRASCLEVIDVTNGGIAVDRWDATVESFASKSKNRHSILAHHWFNEMWVGSRDTGLINIAAKFRSGLDLAIIACALERFFIAHQSYPKDLEELRPTWLERIPHDVVNGEPLTYGSIEDGRYILRSKGVDQDGTDQQDWVWRFPN